MGTEPIHCGALRRSGHPRLKPDISRERLPAPGRAHLLLTSLLPPRYPHTWDVPAASGVFPQQRFRSWVDGIRLLEKKPPDFSEHRPCLDPRKVLGSYALNISFFHLQTTSFYPRHQLSHCWSNIFHQSTSVSLALRYFDLF